MLLAVIFFVFAALLAVVDLLVPSGGILAVAGLLAALGSVYFAFQSGYMAGVMMLTLILVSIPLFIAFALRLWPHSPIGKLVILKAPVARDESQEPAQSALHELIGQVGVTQNALMPYGFVRLLGRSYNAMCESGLIEAGQNVIVTAVQQKNLVVAATLLAVSQPEPAKSPEPIASNENLLDRPAEELGLDSID